MKKKLSQKERTTVKRCSFIDEIFEKQTKDFCRYIDILMQRRTILLQDFMKNDDKRYVFKKK